jgi:plasmid stabilization system protein ParE
MRVVLEDEALDDLDGIHAWIARDNLTSADVTVNRIYDQIDTLGRLPRLGHHGKARGTFEWVVVESSHVVVFEIDSARSELIVTGVFRGCQQIRQSTA